MDWYIYHCRYGYRKNRENYILIELAAKLRELIMNHKDSDDNNLNWKHSEFTN